MEILHIIKHGEDSRTQFKANLSNPEQLAQKLYGEEMILPDTRLEDIDTDLFKVCYEKKYEEPFKKNTLDMSQLLHNMNLFEDGHLNVAGLMLFGQDKFVGRAFSELRAVSFFGTDSGSDAYRDSENFQGKLKWLYDNGMAFMLRNLHKIQQSQSVNSTGILEIPKLVLQELLTNALIHRDYLINAVIRK